jgi:hypothetical protein
MDKTKFQHIIVLCIIFIFATLVVLTSNSFCEWFDFSVTVSIGDAFTGITAPFIGVLSIWLLYCTLCEQQKFNKEQRKVNKEQREVNNWNILFEIKKSIDQAINDFSIETVEGGAFTLLGINTRGFIQQTRIRSSELSKAAANLHKLVELFVLLQNARKVYSKGGNEAIYNYFDIYQNEQSCIKIFFSKCKSKDFECICDLVECSDDGSDPFWKSLKADEYLTKIESLIRN